MMRWWKNLFGRPNPAPEALEAGRRAAASVEVAQGRAEDTHAAAAALRAVGVRNHFVLSLNMQHKKGSI